MTLCHLFDFSKSIIVGFGDLFDNYQLHKTPGKAPLEGILGDFLVDDILFAARCLMCFDILLVITIPR